MIFFYVIIIFATIASSFAGFFLKKSSKKGTIFNIFTNRYLYIGGFLYIIAASFNILVLKRIPYSIVVPLGSITYIWTMIIARIFLKEKISVNKIMGISLIIFGVFCISIK